MSVCKNCGTAMEETYCPRCGQRDRDLERPILGLAGEVLRETFEVDGRMFRTLRTLFGRPGALTTEYLEGHRQRYTPPLRLYLVISVIFFVLMAWAAGRGVLLDDGQTLQADAAGQARLLADVLPRLMFVLLPVFALMQKVLFPGRLYFDHLIYSLHVHCAVYLILGVMLPLERVANVHWLPLVTQLVLLVYLVSYSVISLRRVYGASLLKAVSVSVGVMLAYLTLVAIGVDVSRSVESAVGI